MSIEQMRDKVLKALEKNFTKESVPVNDNAYIQYYEGEDIFKSGVALYVNGKQSTIFQFGHYADSMAGLLYYDDVVVNIAYSILTELSL